jgi:hypothetical protein
LSTTTVQIKSVQGIVEEMSSSISSSKVSINGIVQNGSSFSMTVRNGSSEILTLTNVTTEQGNGTVSTYDLDTLIQNNITDNDTFEVNESAGISITANVFGIRLPFTINFNFVDPITNQSITKSHTFN